MRYQKTHRLPYLLILPGLAFLAFFFSAMWALLVISFCKADDLGFISYAFTFSQYQKFFTDPFYLGYLIRSLHVSFLSTLAVLVIGYPTAYLMVRSTSTIRVLIMIILLVHFLSSYVMRMYGIMLFIGNNGIINRFFEYFGILNAPIRMMYSELGVGIGLATGSLAFVVFSVSSVLEGIDGTVEEAALSLGASRKRIFFEIILPLSLPGVASGFIISFLYNLSSFVTPALLGGGAFDMVSNFIYEQAVELLNYPFASSGAFVLLFISLFIVFLTNKVSEHMIKGVPKQG